MVKIILLKLEREMVERAGQDFRKYFTPLMAVRVPAMPPAHGSYHLEPSVVKITSQSVATHICSTKNSWPAVKSFSLQHA